MPPAGCEPTLRLGVTGLSRAGKTVFITALVQNLIEGGRLPLFRAPRPRAASARAALTPQPDDAVPRFHYEDHLAALTSPTASGRIRRAPSPSCASTIDYERPGRRPQLGPAAADARHRRLSRRMAARSAAARQVLRRLVARDARGQPRAGSRRPLAEAWHASLADARCRRAAPTRRRRGALAAAFTAYLKAGARRARRSRPCRPAAS